ncbi:hypothetical protein PG993_011081 [Apiospora rasikravindrae]|uniref:Uncharacterized protein n=1 Tax=Apiospora rasikravindrae TaxID=990691 RepID=A0ABR1SEE7_9PEZI
MHPTVIPTLISCLFALVAARPGAERHSPQPLESNDGEPPASPNTTQHQLAARIPAGWDWRQCEETGEGWCTVHIATGDGSGRLSADAGDYRSVVLWDNQCDILQALMTSSENPKVTLRGRWGPEKYVDVQMDNQVRPNGWISYDGADTPLGDGSGMACNKPAMSDGVQCRKAFQCSVIREPPLPYTPGRRPAQLASGTRWWNIYKRLH